jgi:hypothetical protein
MSRSLLVFPDVGASPLLDAIASAQKTIRLKMFVFDEPQLLDAIVEAKKRGIDARVMLNPARRSGETENEESRRKLVEAGVSVLDSNPAFDLTHEKSLVIDDAAAYVMSLNWETRKRDGDPRLRGGHEAPEGGRGSGRMLRRGLASHGVHAARGLGAHLVQHQRPRAASRISSTARSIRCGSRTSATRTP